MIATNPYQLFSPIHVAWLYRCRENGLDVTAADLDLIERRQPQAVDDPLFAECRALANAGRLYRRRGRKPTGGRGMLWYAYFAIEEERQRIWDERRSGKRERQYAEDSPIHQAAEIVARELRFGSGRSLLNRLAREGVPKKNY